MNTTSPTLLQKMSMLDPKAWESFVTIYYPLLERWIKNTLCHQLEKEDRIQDIFLEIYKSITRFEHRGKGSFRKWLKTIVHCKTITLLRKKKLNTTSDVNLDEIEASSLGMEWDAIYIEEIQKNALKLVAMEFSKKDWDIFTAIALEETPFEEVMKLHGVKVGKIYLTRFKVLRKYKEIISELI